MGWGGLRRGAPTGVLVSVVAAGAGATAVGRRRRPTVGMLDDVVEVGDRGVAPGGGAGVVTGDEKVPQPTPSAGAATRGSGTPVALRTKASPISTTSTASTSTRPDAYQLYTFVHLTDPEIGIDWPIPLEHALLSDRNLHHPLLRDVTPVAPLASLPPPPQLSHPGPADNGFDA